MSPLEHHILPKLGVVDVERVDQHQIKSVLEPIWHTKASTAEKALGRLNLTLKHAAALGMDVDLQACMKARALLGKQRHVVKHIEAMPYEEAPAFVRWLKGHSGVTAKALLLLVLTVKRTSEVRLATWEEFEGSCWTIPAGRMKWPEEHRVPLSEQAVDLVEELQRRQSSSHLFSARGGKPLSDMAMSKFMTENGFSARPHGFRSTFRSWAEDKSEASFETKEACLAHKVDRGVVAAYQRSDRLEKRRVLLQKWGNFLMS